MKAVFIFFSLIICGEGSIDAGGVLSTINSGGGQATPMIVGGGDAFQLVAPYMVALHNNTRLDYLLYCASSLISPKWCLTAAHCVAGINKNIIDLVAGTNNRNGTGPGAQKRTVANYYVHPNFSPEDDFELLLNDVAMIKASSSFVTNQYIQIIQLPPASPFYPSGDANIWGWGSISTTNTPAQPAVLQTAEVTVVNWFICNLLNLPYIMNGSNVCSGPGDQGACVGDSGGPMTQVSNDTGSDIVTIMAVVSYGWVPCGSALRPTVYSTVPYYRNWVTSTITANSP